jgi:hypothetical protein
MKPTDILHFVRRYKTDLAVFSLCVIIAFGLYLFLGKQMYRSQAEVLVKGTPGAFSSSVSPQESASPPVRAETVKNELLVLTSNDALMATARQIAGPQLSHQEVLKLRQYIGRQLKATVVNGADVVRLSFDFPDPFAAQNVLRTLLDQYKNHYGRSYFDESEQGTLRARADTAQKLFTEAQNKLLDYERENNIFDDRQTGVLNETREQLQISLNALTNEHAYTQRKRDYIQGLMRDIPQEMLLSGNDTPNEAYTRLQERLTRATADHARQLSRDNPDARTLSRLEDEIKQVQALIRKEPRFILDADEKETRVNDVRDAFSRQLLELYPEVEGQKARMDNIRTQVTEIDEALALSAASKGEHNLFLQDMEIKRAIYEQAQADYMMAMGGAVMNHFPLGVVIASPSFNPSPVSPDMGNTLGWAVAVLVLGNCGLFMICLYYDNSITRPWQAAECFKLPVVGMLNDRISVRQPALPYFEAHKDALRELYIKLHSGSPLGKSLFFTRINGGPEEHSPAEAFASYALKYHNRKPVVVRYFPQEESGAALPQDGDETRLPGLPVYTRFAANLAKEQLLWDKLKSNCDMLIIEFAPLRQGEFLFALADAVDEAVIGIEMERSDKKYVQQALTVLRQYGIKNMSLLLHKRFTQKA